MHRMMSFMFVWSLRNEGMVSRLEPSVLDKLVEDTIKAFVDRDLWDDVTDLEDEHIDRLNKIADEWED